MRKTGALPPGPSRSNAAASPPLETAGHPRRFARLRERWHNASLKTSFMGYMLVFLVAALALSMTTAAVFGNLQNSVDADAYELSGLYVYHAENDTLVPARAVTATTEGSTVLVQTVRDDMTEIYRTDLPAGTSVTDASDYNYPAYEAPSSGSLSSDVGAPPKPGELTVATLALYDAWAQAEFEAWLAEHPDSPYADLFPADGGPAENGAAEGEAGEGLLTSAVGYYLSTPPSAGASALSALFGLLTFLMFPLWFGVCIFAAARRFYRMRLAPGLSTLDAAAAKIADQDLDFSVAYDRNDEMGRLAASFETMRASLEQSQRALWRTAEERKRLNAAFAHDLRTPLTILKGKVELLDAHVRSGNATQGQLEASAASLAVQVERLERYVAAMSGLQKLEDRAMAPAIQPFDSVASSVEDIGNALCREKTDASANLHPQSTKGSKAEQCGGRTGGLSFGLSISPLCDANRPDLPVDRSFVEEIAENLVSNAARYAASRVDARLDVRDGFLVLIVEDDGPGFSPEALAQGCAPFFSETPSKDHFGLGLNIAALLCEKHGGSLALGNRAEGGAQATAWLGLRR